jgi:predicted nuclease with RNAse H fold
MKADVTTFIGVDLGGGKGKNTAVARITRSTAEPSEGSAPPVDRLEVVANGTGGFDDQLVEFLKNHAEHSILAIDAPLTLPTCVRCVLPSCPTLEVCDEPIVSWFRQQANGSIKPGTKPKYTPYTQRASEVILHEQHEILPRETLGQGMGPLTARAQYLTRALHQHYRLNENLIEVYPKATLTKLFPDETRKYKRHPEERNTRLKMLNQLHLLTFGPGQWREHAIDNDHKFDAIICAYTAYLWWRGECVDPPNPTIRDDGWIWFPKSSATS